MKLDFIEMQGVITQKFQCGKLVQWQFQWWEGGIVFTECLRSAVPFEPKIILHRW